MRVPVLPAAAGWHPEVPAGVFRSLRKRPPHLGHFLGICGTPPLAIAPAAALAAAGALSAYARAWQLHAAASASAPVYFPRHTGRAAPAVPPPWPCALYGDAGAIPQTRLDFPDPLASPAGIPDVACGPHPPRPPRCASLRGGTTPRDRCRCGLGGLEW